MALGRATPADVTRKLFAFAVAMTLPVCALAASQQHSKAHAVRHSLTLQQKINAASAKARNLQRQLERKGGQLKSATVTRDYWQSQLDSTTSAISSTEAELRDLESRQNATLPVLLFHKRELLAAQRSLELHDREMQRRLVGIYEYGNPNYLSVLVAARSFSDFVESWDDVRLLIAEDQRVVRERQIAAEHVLTIEKRLEAEEIALLDNEQEQAQERSKLGALAVQRRNERDVAERYRHQIASEYDAMEDLTAAQNAYLENLLREQAAQDESGRRAAGIAGGLAHSNGYFSWPVLGIITSPFGWRSNPFGGGPEFHQGLDIAAPSGTTVKAAADGTVLMAQWYGGYGNFILLDNGNGYSTGYAHLSAIYVSKGQFVQRGQAIGAVGSTGYSTGPHLHFEVRVEGKPVDPAPRLIH
jgi:murein DD-endopeptidase MepM/ murein hydrolase activator NlpD